MHVFVADLPLPLWDPRVNRVIGCQGYHQFTPGFIQALDLLVGLISIAWAGKQIT